MIIIEFQSSGQLIIKSMCLMEFYLVGCLAAHSKSIGVLRARYW